MRPRLPQRQALLLSAAILAPCLVLVALGLRLIAQEHQLDNQRRPERRQMLVCLHFLDYVSLHRLARHVDDRETLLHFDDDAGAGLLFVAAVDD